MDESNIRALQELNTSFYAANAVSFSDTRKGGWPGWERCLRALRNRFADGGISLLDVACGNLRFEAYLAQKDPSLCAQVCAVDNCEGLQPDAMPSGLACTFRSADVIDAALRSPSCCETQRSYDAVVCFAFLHHVPSHELRVRILRGLIAQVEPGGIVAVSLWAFTRDSALKQAADVTTAQGLEDHPSLRLEEGDYLLGWRNQSGSYRYCHSFGDEEVTDLIAAVEDVAECSERFSADGRTGNLNEYLVLRALPAVRG